jgi:uncharacterized 2Fe-2S/4Fe-4S cluster protein (DUF4445 family)
MATVHFIPQGIKVSVAAGTRLIDAVCAAGVSIDAPCDGAGTCGKCRTRVMADSWRNLEESAHDLLTQSEHAAGWVLACQTYVRGDLQVEVAPAGHDDLEILSEGHAITVEIAPWVSKSFDPSAANTRVEFGGVPQFTEPGDTTQRCYGLAVDIGTTTLVVSLIDLRDGCELAVASSLNPQARHAQDVLSRIKLAANPEGLQTLHGDLIEQLNRQVAEVASQAKIPMQHIYEAVFSGNTTMMHLATRTNPASLGKYPYTPLLRGGNHFRATEIGLAISSHGIVYLPPIMSAYVGGDITSGILATRLAEQRGTTLFVDIGTNGEMVLAVNGNLTATSTAAGPAFEGMNIACGMRASRGAIEMFSVSDEGVKIKTIGEAEPVGICGSGLIDVVGELAAKGGVDKNGRFRSNGASGSTAWHDRWGIVDGKPVFRIAGPVYLSQKDVRQVQLAKAAIRSGIDLLLKANQLTASEVDRVLIAGSFGFHLRTASLTNLGLLPREFRDRVEFVGNTSKTGAQAFLLNRHLRGVMQKVVPRIQVIELANDPGFEKTFMRSLSF